MPIQKPPSRTGCIARPFRIQAAPRRDCRTGGTYKKLESAVEEMSQIIAELRADNAGLRAEITVLKRVP